MWEFRSADWPPSNWFEKDIKDLFVFLILLFCFFFLNVAFGLKYSELSKAFPSFDGERFANILLISLFSRPILILDCVKCARSAGSVTLS